MPKLSGSSRRNYRAYSRAGRKSSVTAARQSVTLLPKQQSRRNRPVLKALRRPRQAPTKTNMNKNAIVTLSRQVRTLQNQRLGEYQKNIQYCTLQGGTLPQSGSPVAFLVNSLYDHSHVMKGVLTNSVPSFAENAVFQDIVNDTDIAANYQWQTRENDVVSSLVYKPIMSRLNFTFQVEWAGVTPLPGYIRITILRIKPFLASNKLDVALPQTLGAYRYLANESANRNYFNADYHNVLLDKWIKFSPAMLTDSSADRCRTHRTISIPWKFGQSEICRPDHTGDPAERFWTNTPEASQTWCLISCGAQLDVALKKLDIGRVNSWRDQHGTT